MFDGSLSVFEDHDDIYSPNQALHAMSAALACWRFGSLLGGTHA
jgi:hypothetical protein